MNSTNRVYTITHEQWEYFNGLDARVRALLKESEERQRTLAQLNQQCDDQFEKYREQLAERAEMIVDLAQKEADQRSANRRTSAALVETLKALRALVDVCQDVRDEEGWTKETGALWERMKEAREVMAAYGIPF